MSKFAELNSILGNPDNLSLSKTSSGIDVTYGNMYRPPNCNLPLLIEVSKFFGTQEIDVDDYNCEGCDTCDYGSDYGHILHIYNVTKNFDILDEPNEF